MGPALLWAIVTSPALIISTTAIPKCSASMVWKPIEHFWKTVSKSLKGGFFINDTLFSSFYYATYFFNLSNNISSSALRQEPTKINFSLALTSSSFILTIAYSKHFIYFNYSFSGLNWAKLIIVNCFSLTSIDSRFFILQGGYNLIGWRSYMSPLNFFQTDLMFWSVQVEFVSRRSHLLPA